MTLFAVAGISVMAGTGGGLYWLVPAAILSICIAILNSWVLVHPDQPLTALMPGRASDAPQGLFSDRGGTYPLRARLQARQGTGRQRRAAVARGHGGVTGMGTHGRSLAVATMAALTILVGTVGAPVAARSGSATAETGLLASLGTHTSVTRNTATDRVGYLGGPAARPVASASALGHPTTALAASRTFLFRFGPLFGITDAPRELRVTGTDRVGTRTFVRYQQVYRGVPVVAGELHVQLAANGDVISVNGEASPEVSLSTRAGHQRGPGAHPRHRRHGLGAQGPRILAACRQPALAIYDPRVAGDPYGLPVARLAWRVDVTSRTARPSDGWPSMPSTACHGRGSTHSPSSPRQPTRNSACATCRAPGDRGEGTTDPLQCDVGDTTQVANPAGSSLADIKGAYKGAQATFVLRQALRAQQHRRGGLATDLDGALLPALSATPVPIPQRLLGRRADDLRRRTSPRPTTWSATS